MTCDRPPRCYEVLMKKKLCQKCCFSSRSPIFFLDRRIVLGCLDPFDRLLTELIFTGVHGCASMEASGMTRSVHWRKGWTCVPVTTARWRAILLGYLGVFERRFRYLITLRRAQQAGHTGLPGAMGFPSTNAKTEVHTVFHQWPIRSDSLTDSALTSLR